MNGWIRSVSVCLCVQWKIDDGTSSASSEPEQKENKTKTQCALLWIVRCALTHAYHCKKKMESTDFWFSFFQFRFFLSSSFRYLFHSSHVLILICRFSVKTDLHTGKAVSRLYIANANRHDSGNYTCALGDFAKVTVSVHVLNGE